MAWSGAATAKIVPRGTSRERTSPASAGAPVNEGEATSMARLFPAVGVATSRRDRSGHGTGSEPDADAGAGDDLPRRADRRPAALLAALIAAYVAVFGSLTWSQQSNFGTFGFDMGIYDQGIWLLSRFKDPFVTVRGLEYFGHHVNPVTLLFVPFYWLGAGPHFLYLVETVWMALGAVPLWLLARDRLHNPWTALVPAGAYLLYPALEWINWWHFHPDALIITPLLAAWLLATRRQWRWFAVAVAVALLCKEDAALAVFVMGLVLAVRGERRVGLATAAAGAAWFVLATKVVIPWANHGVGPLYEQLFPQFGNSVGEIVLNVLRHPDRAIALAVEPGRLTYYTQLLAPVAFLPLFALPVLLIGVPQVGVNVISAHGYTHDIRYHYTAIVVAAVFLATVEACAWLGNRPSRQRFLVGLVAAAALAGNVAWSPSPIGVKFHSGIWASPQPKHAAVNEAIRRVPAGAGVAASYYLVPHLTHRVHIYEWPNPFVPTNWGVRGERPPDPASADYLVLDTALNGQNQDLFEQLTGAQGPFRVIWQRDGIVVAARTRDG
jgi:uncharacterized membrane protein